MHQGHGVLGREKQHSPPTASFPFPQQSVAFILTQFWIFQALISTVAQGPSTCKTELSCQLLMLSTGSLAFGFFCLFVCFNGLFRKFVPTFACLSLHMYRGN